MGRRAALLLVFLLGMPGQGAAASEESSTLTRIGDALRIAMPVGALGATFLAGDGDGHRWDRIGSQQFLLAFGGTVATTYLAKAVNTKVRPDAQDDRSFPSGHTSVVFSAASFVDMRYGRWWGLPAYALAALTGYSRVQADKHFADDVVAGASIGLLWTWAAATPRTVPVRVRPFLGGDGAGVLFEWGGTQRTRSGGSDGPGDWSYRFFFGKSNETRNEVTAPEAGGTTFDLAQFENVDQPTTTAEVTLGYSPAPAHEFSLLYSPFESRDQGAFAAPVRFAGVEFPPDSPISSAWRLQDIRFRWRYRMEPGRFRVDVGAGLVFEDITVSLSGSDSLTASQRSVALLPTLNAGLAWEFLSGFRVEAWAEGGHLPSGWLADVRFRGTWTFHPRWTAGVGFRSYSRELTTDELRNRADFSVPFGVLEYGW